MTDETPQLSALLDRITVDNEGMDWRSWPSASDVERLIEHAADLERQLSAALSKVREVERERDAFVQKGEIVKCKNVVSSTSAPRTQAFLVEGGSYSYAALAEHAMQMEARAESAATRIAELEADISMLVGAIDFHNGHGTPSIDRAVAEVFAARQKEATAPTLICPKCGVDRYKEACRDHTNCPMVGQAARQKEGGA